MTNEPTLRPTLGLILSVLALSACATVQREARLSEVREAVGQRIGHNIAWNQNSDQDREVRDAVRRLLRQELTAEAAIQVALLNNRHLQASYESLGIAQADLVEAGLLQNPTFSLLVVKGGAGTITESAIVQDFVSLLSLSARKKVGEAAARRASLEVAESVVDLAAEVQAQYYTVVGGAQALELAHQVVDATEAGAELAQRQRSAGNLSLRDQTVQQALYAQTLLDVAQAEAQLQSDREKLNRLMGVWGEDTNWKAPTRLPAIPDALPSLDQMEARAIERRLDLAAAKSDAEAAAQALNLTRQFRYLGPLGIGVAYKREPDLGKFLGPTVELGLPIFNQRQADVARAEADFKRSQERVAALAVDIRSQAREARARLLAASGVVHHYKTVLLPLQQTIVRETLKLYNGMLVGVYDLLLAKQNQIQTARQYVAANRGFWLAWTELEQAVGEKIAPSTPSSFEHPPAAPPTTTTPGPAERKGGEDHSHQHGEQ